MSETPPTPFDDQHDSSGHPEDHPNLPGLDDLVESGWEPLSEEAQQVLDTLQPLEALRETPLRRTSWSMPPWPASKQRPHPWLPVLRQSHHPSRPAVVLVAGSISVALIFLGGGRQFVVGHVDPVGAREGVQAAQPRRTVLGPTSEPSVPQLSRLPVTTVEKCLRRIGTWSPRWPPFASLLTTAIVPTRGSIAHAAVEKRKVFPSIRFRWDPVGFGWIDLIRGGHHRGRPQSSPGGQHAGVSRRQVP